MLVFLKHLVTHNWVLKSFSLLLAGLMWFAIWSGSNDQMSRTVSLAFRNIPDNMEITPATEILVTLQLRGSVDLLAGLATADITPTISLAGEEPGRKSIPILPGNIDTPPGVGVFGVTPDRIEFNLERTIRKDVEIQASVEGNPADGYLVNETFVTPAVMPIEGPESSVDPIEALSTAPIRIDGSRGSVSASVNLEVPDAMVRLDSFAPVDVFVQIIEIPSEVSFEIGPAPQIAGAWNMNINRLEVRVRGPKSQIEAFDPAGVHFSFDELSAAESGTVIPDVVGLPETFTVVSRSPRSLTVTPAR